MTVAQAQAQARSLISQEKNTGAAWAPIISTLGYDPRQGYGKSTGLNFSAAWQAGQPSAQASAGKPEPTPGAPAAGAPAAPAKPPMPGRIYDSQYTTDVAGINLRASQGYEDIATNRSRLTYDTGYNAAGQIDVTNPYSQALGLQKHWEESRRGTSNSMAARGQLYSGARRAALQEVDYQRNKGDANLREFTRRGNEDLATGEQRLAAETALGIAGAGSAQTTRWQDQERDWYALYG